MLGVFSSIEDTKTAAAAVLTGHCFPDRLTANKLESVDRHGSVCDFLQTVEETFGFENYDFESKTAVYLSFYKKGILELRVKFFLNIFLHNNNNIFRDNFFI